MRGTLWRGCRQGHDHGIIPAHAGNTLSCLVTRISFRDHPRACGEHLVVGGEAVTSAGSSPRMRGTQIGIKIHRYSPVDHPRACGEHRSTLACVCALLGSSPRMRGTRKPGTSLWRSSGIIPAHAGNTPSTTNTKTPSRDHPRACGEHYEFSRSTLSIEGSSPRMRGTRMSTLATRYAVGIIPAHAGNTKLHFMSSLTAWDHPRACGEHAKKLARYQGIRLRISVFSFSFTLSTSSPFDICWHYSNHAEEYQRMMLPSFL